MAQAYVPIQTVTLTGTSATIDFTNIPQTYTDLSLVISSRSTNASDYPTVTNISFNGSTSNFSGVYLENASGTVGAFTDQPRMVALSPGANTTSNTFGNSQCYIANYTSSNNKAFTAEAVGENNGTRSYQEIISNLWSNSAAITSISLSPASGSFAANSTATLYGIGGARASGGTITADARYTYHTFTSTGTFTALEKIKGAELLIVAGGGAGAAGSGGGGGAGGVAYGTPQTLTSGNTYTVVVGAGGTGAGGTVPGASGSNSSVSSIIAFGGGGGGNRLGSTPNGVSGGSGGGGSTDGYVGGAATQISGLNYIGYGNNGGDSPGSQNPGGGGGGAGAVGQVGGSTNPSGGDGGVGTSLFSSWGYATSTGQLSDGIYYYAGGGGGSYNNAASGDGGLGGGGANGKGIATNGVAGTANTGGGGGAGTAGGVVGGSGGSGLVIIRYPN